MAATIANSPFEHQREKISNENIFFIEIGFGNDSHGQVCMLLSLLCCFSLARSVNNHYCVLFRSIVCSHPPRLQ